MISDNGKEISWLTSFRILTGILLGPDDLFKDKDRIVFETSSGVTGERNSELWLERLRKEEEFLEEGGTLDLMDSAIEEKYELKEFATSAGLELTTPFILKDMGWAALDDLRDMISLTPCQKFLTLFE